MYGSRYGIVPVESIHTLPLVNGHMHPLEARTQIAEDNIQILERDMASMEETIDDLKRKVDMLSDDMRTLSKDNASNIRKRVPLFYYSLASFLATTYPAPQIRLQNEGDSLSLEQMIQTISTSMVQRQSAKFRAACRPGSLFDRVVSPENIQTLLNHLTKNKNEIQGNDTDIDNDNDNSPNDSYPKLDSRSLLDLALEVDRLPAGLPADLIKFTYCGHSIVKILLGVLGYSLVTDLLEDLSQNKDLRYSPPPRWQLKWYRDYHGLPLDEEDNYGVL